MRSGYKLMSGRKWWVLSASALSSLLLAGCQGLGTQPATTTTTPPPPGSYQLTVTAPAGQGTITSTPAGISCPSQCTASFAKNTQVTLTAAASSGYFFGGWSGSCSGTSTCSVTITAAATVAATFNAGDELTVAAAGGGTGTVTSNPAGINCSDSPSATSNTCSANFAPGTAVTLSETPASGSTFGSWSGACTGTTSCSVTLSAASSVTATFGGSLQSSINHIILFSQENRSLDHYFGYMRQYWANNGIPDQQFDGLPQFNQADGINPPPGPVPQIPGCNIANDASTCDPDPTNPISSFSFHNISVCQEEQSPFWNEAHNDWDYQNPADNPPEANPPLNGFVWTAAYDARSTSLMDVNGVRAMGYFEDTDLNYYYFMATNFGTSDRWFSPVMSRTQINRMYMLAATSQGYAYPIGSNSNDDKVLTTTPIFEALQNAGITWKIYVNPDNTNGCNNDISDANSLCLIPYSYINMFAYEKTIIDSAGQNPDLLLNIAPVAQFSIDAANNALPQFALIEPASTAGLDEHPSDSDDFPVDVQQGANYVSGLINSFMNSPSWSNSALIFTYDEGGGYYDHVPPQPTVAPGNTTADPYSPIDLEPAISDICTKTNEPLGQGTCDFAWTGYRVPLIVISPYSVKNFVSHTVRDTTAVLAMVENRFGIAPLTARDAAQPNMNEFFDFVNKPWATPPTPPAQSLAGTCTLTPPASWNEPPTPSGTGTPNEQVHEAAR